MGQNVNIKIQSVDIVIRKSTHDTKGRNDSQLSCSFAHLLENFFEKMRHFKGKWIILEENALSASLKNFLQLGCQAAPLFSRMRGGGGRLFIEIEMRALRGEGQRMSVLKYRKLYMNTVQCFRIQGLFSKSRFISQIHNNFLKKKNQLNA